MEKWKYFLGRCRSSYDFVMNLLSTLCACKGCKVHLRVLGPLLPWQLSWLRVKFRFLLRATWVSCVKVKMSTSNSSFQFMQLLSQCNACTTALKDFYTGQRFSLKSWKHNVSFLTMTHLSSPITLSAQYGILSGLHPWTVGVSEGEKKEKNRERVGAGGAYHPPLQPLPR